MRMYVQKEYKLLMMNPGLKLVTSVFLFFVLLGYAVGLALGLAKSGLGLQALTDYYRGNESLGLYSKSAIELLEVTHFHLLSIPIVYLIVCHLMMMTYFHFWTRMAFIFSGLIGMILDLASPWLICYVSGHFAFLKILGTALFGFSFIGMVLIQFYEMFLRKEPYDLTGMV